MNLPYYKYARHWNNAARPRGRYENCTAGIISRNGYFYTGDKVCKSCDAAEDEGSGMKRAQFVHLFNAVLLADFHQIPKVGKFGSNYVEEILCSGKSCTLCSNNVQKEFGRTVYFSANFTYAKQLNAYNTGTLARSCACNGELSVVAFECPSCKAIIRDLNDDPATPEELDSLYSERYRCPSCKDVNFPDEICECDNCKDPNPLSLFNTKLEIYTTEEKDSDNRSKKSLQFGRYRFFKNEERKRIENKLIPFDFHRLIYGATPKSSHESRTEDSGYDAWKD
jgi:hypothetical protein